MIHVTEHAIQRGIERFNLLPYRTIELADQAYKHGITFDESYGKLKQHMKWLYTHPKHPDKVTIHRFMVFIFKNNRLLTVLPLPFQYWNSVDKLLRHRRDLIR